MLALSFGVMMLFRLAILGNLANIPGRLKELKKGMLKSGAGDDRMLEAFPFPGHSDADALALAQDLAYGRHLQATGLALGDLLEGGSGRPSDVMICCRTHRSLP